MVHERGTSNGSSTDIGKARKQRLLVSVAPNGVVGGGWRGHWRDTMVRTADECWRCRQVEWRCLCGGKKKMCGEGRREAGWLERELLSVGSAQACGEGKWSSAQVPLDWPRSIAQVTSLTSRWPENSQEVAFGALTGNTYAYVMLLLLGLAKLYDTPVGSSPDMASHRPSPCTPVRKRARRASDVMHCISPC